MQYKITFQEKVMTLKSQNWYLIFFTAVLIKKIRNIKKKKTQKSKLSASLLNFKAGYALYNYHSINFKTFKDGNNKNF